MKLKNLTNVPESERRPMTKAESELFLMLTIGAPDDMRQPVPASELEAALGKLFKPLMLSDLSTQMLVKRLQQTSASYDPRTVAMACFLADRPGFAVLWAYTLYSRGEELGRPYSFDDLTLDFPLGFPTNDGAAEIWDAQKGWAQKPPIKTDNLLDGRAPWGAKETTNAA